jgi:hypothetical protein
MSTLSVYMDHEGKVKIHYSGFSWLAAFALPLWLYHRGLYNIFIILFSIIYSFLFLFLPIFLVQNEAVAIFFFGLPLLVGYKANSLHLYYLTKNHYYKVAGELM